MFNTSNTLSTAQALAIVLGISALLGGLAAAAYFLLLTMGDDGKEGGYGSGGSGGGYGGE